MWLQNNEMCFVIIGKEDFLVRYATKTIFAFIFAKSTKKYFTNLVTNNALFLPKQENVRNL